MAGSTNAHHPRKPQLEEDADRKDCSLRVNEAPREGTLARSHSNGQGRLLTQPWTKGLVSCSFTFSPVPSPAGPRTRFLEAAVALNSGRGTDWSSSQKILF